MRREILPKREVKTMKGIPILKGCPFCGREVKLRVWINGYFIMAKHTHVYTCPLRGQGRLTRDYCTKDELIKYWNTRQQ